MSCESKPKRILMVIPINNSKFNKLAAKYVKPVVAPDFELHVTSIDAGTPYIQSRWAIAQNAPHVIELVRSYESSYDGVFVSDFDNCGVEAVRECVKIPVLGGFAPQVLTMLSLAQRFSIITMSDSLLALDNSHVRQFGQNDNLCSVRSINMSIEDAGKHDKLVEEVCKAGHMAITHDGAQGIVLGCTAMMGVAEPVKQFLVEHDLPVVVTDPNLCGITFLQMLVRCGLSQSGLTYVYPPKNLETQARRPRASFSEEFEPVG